MASFFRNWGFLLIISGLLMTATVFLAKPAAAALPEKRELCDVISEPGFFTPLTGEDASMPTSEITCPATAPFCDKENKVCVQCLTPDKTGYDKSKTCQSGNACIKGRCVPLETPLPKLSIKDPKTGETRQLEITGPASYILYLYNLGLRVAGVLAFLLVLFYGALYIVSAGNEKKTAEYKEKLGNVLVGVIVLLGSYIILQTINPTLTQLKEPQFKIKLSEYVGVCNEDKNKIELWTKNKLEEEEQKTEKKFRTYSEAFVGLSCRCQIEKIFWGELEDSPPSKIYNAGDEVPFTVVTPGCQTQNDGGPDKRFSVNLYVDRSWPNRNDVIETETEKIKISSDIIRETWIMPSLNYGDTAYIYLEIKDEILTSGEKIQSGDIRVRKKTGK